jgi:F0F1-type ATP synthase membrane subunit c/vacuolar-type H+-ATPase subunit K
MRFRHNALAVLVAGILLGSTGAAAQNGQWLRGLPQAGVGEAIGLVCARLIELSARLPEDVDLWKQLYADAVADLRSHPIISDSSAALGLGLACGGLLEAVARNPAFESQLQDLYDDQCKPEILSLPRSPLMVNVALGSSQVWDRYMEGVSRNPELTPKLTDIRDECLADIRALGKR